MGGEGPGIAKARRESSVLDAALDQHRGPALVRGILQDLEALLDRGSRLEARLRGDTENGEAWLIRPTGTREAHILRVSWNCSQIGDIEVESQMDPSELDRLPPTDPAQVVERLVPMLWSHLREGKGLPADMKRFAPFFSLR